MYAASPFTVTLNPSREVGNVLPLEPKSAAVQERLVAARLLPLIVMYVLAAMPPVGCAALVTAALVMLGLAEMLPSSPCFCEPGPAVKYSLSASPTVPRPKLRPHNPGIVIVLPGVPKSPPVPLPSWRVPRSEAHTSEL